MATPVKCDREKPAAPLAARKVSQVFTLPGVLLLLSGCQPAPAGERTTEAGSERTETTSGAEQPTEARTDPGDSFVGECRMEPLGPMLARASLGAAEHDDTLEEPDSPT
jgi:hypothetical protein